MWKSKWLSSCHRSSYQPGVPTIIINFTLLSFNTLKAKIKEKCHLKITCMVIEGVVTEVHQARDLDCHFYIERHHFWPEKEALAALPQIFFIYFTWKFSNQPFHRVCDASWTPELKIRQKRCSIWSLLQFSTKIISSDYYSCYVPASRRSRGWVSRASSKSPRPLCSGWLARSRRSTRQGFSK